VRPCDDSAKRATVPAIASPNLSSAVRSRVLVFDVPEGRSPAAIELHELMFSSGALVSLVG
jgi:hypothetical protein